MSTNLTSDQIEDIVDRVTGYVNGYDRVLQDEALDLDAGELDELLLDNNVEKCPQCEFYVDSHELLDSDGEIDGHCDNCRQN